MLGSKFAEKLHLIPPYKKIVSIQEKVTETMVSVQGLYKIKHKSCNLIVLGVQTATWHYIVNNCK